MESFYVGFYYQHNKQGKIKTRIFAVYEKINIKGLEIMQWERDQNLFICWGFLSLQSHHKESVQ